METENKTEQLAISVESAGKMLGISRATAYLLVNTGRIPALKISDRRWVVPVAALKKLLESAELEKDQPGGSCNTRVKHEDGGTLET